MMYQPNLARFLAVACFCFLVVGCVDNTNEPGTKKNENKTDLQILKSSVDSSKSATDQKLTVAQQQGQRQAVRAQSLIRYFYGDALEVKNITMGPSGTIEILLNNRGDGESITAYMLPDGEHLIFGKLISPFQEYSKKLAEAIIDNAGEIKVERQHMQPLHVPSKGAERADPETIQRIQSVNTGIESMTNLTSSSSATTSQKTSSVNKQAPVESAEITDVATLPENHNRDDQDALYKRVVSQAHTVSEGIGPKTVYAFIDLNCPACRDSHRILKKYIEDDSVTVKWIPVAIKGKDSIAKATALLAFNKADNSDVASSIDRLFKNASLAELGGVSINEEDASVAYKAYAQNTLLLKEMPMPATPTFVFMSERGGRVLVPSSKKDIEKMIDNVIDS